MSNHLSKTSRLLSPLMPYPRRGGCTDACLPYAWRQSAHVEFSEGINTSTTAASNSAPSATTEGGTLRGARPWVYDQPVRHSYRRPILCQRLASTPSIHQPILRRSHLMQPRHRSPNSKSYISFARTSGCQTRLRQPSRRPLCITTHKRAHHGRGCASSFLDTHF